METKKEEKMSLFERFQEFLKKKEKPRKEITIGKYKYYIKD